MNIDESGFHAFVTFQPAARQHAGAGRRIVALVGDGADAPDAEGCAPASVACFFSGGVDSWYSALRNQDRITHLILVRGFDIGLDNDTLWDTARTELDAAARRLGKRVITCETNLREIADRGRAKWGAPFAGDFWGKCLHGAALGACAAALRGTVREVIVPATHTTATLKPWGSSPLLDKFWSGGGVRIVHDGCEANRFEKVRHISRSDIALQSLRVCYQNLAHTNCGHCEKCVRTMIALHVCGALDRTPAFGDADPFAKLRRLDVPAHVIRHYELLLAEARSAGDMKLSRYLEVILERRFSAERALAKLVRRMRTARRREAA